MSYKIYWLVENCVLHICYSDNIEDQDLPEINERLKEYLNKGESPVHVISDLSELKRLQPSLKTSQQLLPILRDKRWGWIIIVGANPMVQFFSTFVTQFFQKKMYTFKTVDEAKYALGIEDSRLTDIFIATKGKT